VARAGGSIHFILFRRGEGPSDNDERPGKVQESTFSDDRQHCMFVRAKFLHLRVPKPHESCSGNN
jgi:hypothetical protein